jgi:hypothetical protein
MEQPCYKCGQAIDEGIPFCPHCKAPQIRVVIAEPVPAPIPLAATATPQGSAVLAPPPSVPVLAIPMEWPKAVIPSALAALVASLLMTLGLNFFVAMLSAGFLAVVFYRQRQRGAVTKASTGARLGALSGLFCSGLTALLAALAATVPDLRTKMREQIIENAQKWSAGPPDPQLQAALDLMKTPQGLAMVLIVGGIFLLVLSIALGTLGGALGGAILGRRDKS